MNETLIIHNVDLSLLEDQRAVLHSIIMDDGILSTFDSDQQDALQGIIDMLDEWSDKIYFNEHDKE